MPINIPSDLPARAALEQENIFVMTEERATSQDIRPLDIVIVNLMPTKITTETQLLRVLGNTPIQVDAIADSIREYVEKTIGVRPYNYDGYQNSQWIVLDYGSIYVHVFLPEYRNRYNLEQLWNDAPITNIPDLD